MTRQNTLDLIGSLLRPGGILILAAWALQHEEVVRASAVPYVPYFCFGALTTAVLLSWYYDQARLICLAAALILTVLALKQWPDAVHTGKLAVVLLLPLNVLACAFIEERGVLTPLGVAQIAGIGGQVFGVTWIAGANYAGVDAVVGWGARGTAFTWLPWTAQLLYALTALGLLVMVFRRRTTVDQGLFWTVVAMGFAAHSMSDPAGLFIYAGTAGLVLVFTVLEHGYDIAYRDDLTGLPGRRAFNTAVHQLTGSYSIAVCDVDNFKHFNDTYGHEVGNQALRMVASKLAQVGGGGRAFRYGGEEFLIVFRGRTARQAEPFAEALRRDVGGTSFVVRGPNRPARRPAHPVKPAGPGAPPIHITISIGIAERSSTHNSPERVLDAADAALYKAKEAGRDCVKLA